MDMLGGQVGEYRMDEWVDGWVDEGMNGEWGTHVTLSPENFTMEEIKTQILQDSYISSQKWRVDITEYRKAPLPSVFHTNQLAASHYPQIQVWGAAWLS